MNTIGDFFKPPKQLPGHLDGSRHQLVPEKADVLGSDPKSFLDPFSEHKWHEDRPLGDRMTEPSTEEEGRKPPQMVVSLHWSHPWLCPHPSTPLQECISITIFS